MLMYIRIDGLPLSVSYFFMINGFEYLIQNRDRQVTWIFYPMLVVIFWIYWFLCLFYVLPSVIDAKINSVMYVSTLCRSVVPERFSSRQCGEDVLLFSEFINIMVISILSQTELNCYIFILIFVLSGTTSRNFTKPCLVNFQLSYQHILVQVG